jgi:YbbR domain-containing protein
MIEKTRGVNVPIALWSLLLSFLLWFVVFPAHLSRRAQKFVLELRYIGLNQHELHLSKIPNQITVSAKVSNDEYNAIIAKGPYAEIDLANAKAGSNTISTISIYPSDLQQKVSEISKVTVLLERMRKNEVIVTTAAVGKLSDPGLIVDDIVSETKRVLVEGPESLVGRVSYAQANLKLDMVDPHSNDPVEVILEPFDASHHLVGDVELHPSKVLVMPKLMQSPQSKQVFVEAQFIGKVPEGFMVQSYNVEPDRVTAIGPSRFLKRFNKVVTEPIDVSQLTSTQTLTAKVQEPAGLTGLDTKEVKVTITITPSTVKGLNPEDGKTKPRSKGGDPGNPQ